MTSCFTVQLDGVNAVGVQMQGSSGEDEPPSPAGTRFSASIASQAESSTWSHEAYLVADNQGELGEVGGGVTRNHGGTLVARGQ